MTGTFKWWGFDVRTTPTYQSGAVGVVVGSQRMWNATYATGRRIADAGTAGLDVNDVSRTDVEILRSAGVSVSKDPLGQRYFIADLPDPTAYLLEAPKSASKPQWGQFGSSGIPKK